MPKKEDATDPALRATLASVFEEIAAYFDELDGESPRAAAILAVSALEDELERLLRAQFPDTTSNATWKKVAGPGFTPLGSLNAKADVAQAFGFYGTKTRTTIGRIAEVRNKFAHRTNVRDFDHPSILEICRKLADNPVFPYSLIESPRASDIKWNFVSTVKELTNRLSDIRTHVPELDDDLPQLS